VKLLNSSESWGLVSIILHWVSAIVVVGLFALGLWMMSLDYYSEWYRIAPDWHKSIGVIFIFIVVARLLWRVIGRTPKPLENHQRWEKISAHLAHFILYLLLISMLPTGYLIVTASGQGLEVFNWFTLPSLVDDIDNLEDIAGLVHEWVAYTIMAIAALHALGALKHHFIDKDITLLRMLGRNRRN